MTTIEMIKNLAQRNSVVASADVLAVFEELEVKDKHIAELENESLVHRHRAYAAENKVTELQAKLATPVRLQSPWVDKVGNRWLLEGTTADVIRAAGFAATIEGDE
ncbi:hypothetical protein [Serratia bockelmannii]|uniref:hypothetical protein n=1 Tax=Serratia bockelmannii TaxID=2703793 RepID=UPI00313D27CA